MIRAYIVLGLCAVASPACAASFSIADVANYANIVTKMILLALAFGGLAALGLTVAKVLPYRPVTGGSAYVASLRWAAPGAAAAGAMYLAVTTFVAIAQNGQAGPVDLYAPVIAEAALLLLAGAFVGSLAALCHALINARIDNVLLKS